MKKAEHILSQAVKTVVTILLLALTVLVTYCAIYSTAASPPPRSWCAISLYGRHSSASFWVCRKNPI